MVGRGRVFQLMASNRRGGGGYSIVSRRVPEFKKPLDSVHAFIVPGNDK